jgi:hypothetical protein
MDSGHNHTILQLDWNSIFIFTSETPSGELCGSHDPSLHKGQQYCDELDELSRLLALKARINVYSVITRMLFQRFLFSLAVL